MNDNQTTGHENPNHPMHDEERDWTLEDALDQMRDKCDDWVADLIEAEIMQQTHRARSGEYRKDLSELKNIWQNRILEDRLTFKETQQTATILNKY